MLAGLPACKGDTTVNAGSNAGGAGGSGGEADAAETMQLLIGKWASADIGQFGAVAVSMDQVLTFSPGAAHFADTVSVFRTSSPAFAGCREHAISSGIYAVTGAPGALRLDFHYSDGTTTRSGCQSATDDVSQQPLTAAELALNDTTGGVLVLDGDVFTLRNTITGVEATWAYTRVP